MKSNPPLRPYPLKEPAAPVKPAPKREKPGISGILWQVGRWSFRILVLLLLLIGSSLGGAYAALKQNFAHLSDVSQLARYAPIEATEILDSQGRLLHKLYGEENRKVIKLEDVPDHVQKAIISAEDARFYEHKGVDPVGLARAFKINLDKQDAVQGGSTITQQVVKNLFLTPERTVQRKLAEMWMSIEVEKNYSKNQILELYLNQIYWGHNAYGIEAAANNYFGKSVSKLNLAEGALLAGILTGPELYSPYRNPDKAKIRQELTLDRMSEIGFISYEQAKEAKAVKLKYPGIKAGSMKYPYFTSYVLSLIKENYGESEAFKRGLKVYTTLNADWQSYGEKALREHIQQHKGAKVSQAALIAIENQTGFVRAIVGGTSYKQSQFNRAWQAQRQPGSAFKPFVYLTAFARGFRPTHRMIDEPIQYRFGSYLWRPRNYGGGHSGIMTLQRALEISNNIIAVKLGERVGNGNVIDTAHRMGIRSPMRNVLSLALGPSEVTPLEMASAYSTMARNGTYLEPTPILKVEDRDGNVLEDNRNRQSELVYSAEACSTLTQVMKGVIQQGTGTVAQIGRPAAGKTGTTSDHKDAWFVGFTPQVTTAVWVGNDKPVPMYGYATGGHLSAPLWARFMRYAHTKIPKKDFVKVLPVSLPQNDILPNGTPIDAPDNSGYIPAYERLNKTREGDKVSSDDPFLLDPADVPMVPFNDSGSLSDPPVDNVPMQLPDAQTLEPGFDPSGSKSTDPQPPKAQAPTKNQTNRQNPVNKTQPAVDPATDPGKEKMLENLDELIKDLDRLNASEQ